jgi:hypothetical protein
MLAMAVWTAADPQCRSTNRPIQIYFDIAETGTAIGMMKSPTAGLATGKSIAIAMVTVM